MNLIEKTRETLLTFFPEQAAAEAEALAAAVVEGARQAEIDAAASTMENLELPGAVQPGPAVEVPAEPATAPAKPRAKEEIPPEPPRQPGVQTVEYDKKGVHLDILCSAEQIGEIASILDTKGFFLESISGVDWIKEEQMEVVYDYNRFDLDSPCRVAVRARISRSKPEIPTISAIFPGANWHERETHDFFGITFTGHPYLVPLLLPEDADFHPLLKDFKP